MIAKQTGGDAASGTYIGFYDCHVAPAQDWFKELWLFVTFHKCIPSDFDCSFFILLYFSSGNHRSTCGERAAFGGAYDSRSA